MNEQIKQSINKDHCLVVLGVFVNTDRQTVIDGWMDGWMDGWIDE